ncbi:MAG: hypothetical protein MJ229_02390 [bacterium]|nr:hypothetical protein [bacterium]
MINFAKFQTFSGQKEQKPMKNSTEFSSPKDAIYKSSAKNRIKAKTYNASQIPSYVERGLKGDPDSNFHEFMTISKVPYFIGGPGLVATILAGSNVFDIKANNAAKINGKGMALGCLCYYLMTAVAKACVDAPVKLFRGIDLNQKISTNSFNKPYDEEGHSQYRKEYHNLYESSKFIRWNLTNPNEPQYEYNKIAQKMGIPEDAADKDSIMRPIISTTIKRANAWKYLIGAFGVMLGVGFGNQQALKENFMTGAIADIKNNKSIKNIAQNAKIKVAKPIAEAFKSLWKGSDSLGSKITGKFAILGFAASVLLANISILNNSKYVADKEAK